MGKKVTTVDFITKSTEVHGDIYSYANSTYIDSKTKIEIICPKHGSFYKIPSKHISGQGCPICSKEKSSKNLSLNNDEFIKRANEIHNGKYDYSQVKYINMHTNIEILCPDHGVYTQQPQSHLNGANCPKCSSHTKLTEHDLSERMKGKFSQEYTYLGRDGDKLIINCPKHGEFRPFRNNHTRLKNPIGCPKCSNTGVSKGEQEVINFVKSVYSGKILESVRDVDVIGTNRELDIYIPDLKLAIEYNGLYWHSNQHKAKNYHAEKSERARRKGIHLIHIYEDSWNHAKAICKSILSTQLKSKTNTIIGARTLEVKSLSTEEIKSFLSVNHIQGFRASSAYLGLCDEFNDIKAVATFGNSTFNSNFQWELVRACSKLNHIIIGGLDKLFKHFLNTYNPESILCYSDASLFSGDSYERIGFNRQDKLTNPTLYYIANNKRVNRLGFTRAKLQERNLLIDPNLSAHNNTVLAGINHIYCVGNHIFTWNKH